MAILNAVPAPLTSSTFAADLDLLGFLDVRLLADPGLPRPLFGDDAWDFSALADVPAYARIPTSIRADWSTIANPAWRLCAKEVGLALLQPRVGLERRLGHARRTATPPIALVQHVGRWLTWFTWLEAHGVKGLDDVTQAHCDAWLVERLVQTGRGAVGAEVRGLRCFADYAALLTADAYAVGFYPWPGRSAAEVAGYRRQGENTTPVIPDEVFGPLLAASLFLVGVAGPDVLAAAPSGGACRPHRRRVRASNGGSSDTWPASAPPDSRCPRSTSATSTTSVAGTSSTRLIRCTASTSASSNARSAPPSAPSAGRLDAC